MGQKCHCSTERTEVDMPTFDGRYAHYEEDVAAGRFTGTFDQYLYAALGISANTVRRLDEALHATREVNDGLYEQMDRIRAAAKAAYGAMTADNPAKPLMAALMAVIDS